MSWVHELSTWIHCIISIQKNQKKMNLLFLSSSNYYSCIIIDWIRRKEKQKQEEWWWYSSGSSWLLSSFCYSAKKIYEKGSRDWPMDQSIKSKGQCCCLLLLHLPNYWSKRKTLECFWNSKHRINPWTFDLIF